jgi:predicted N-acyltransferase
VAEQGVTTEVLHGDAIPDALFEPLFRCYLATVDAHYYGRRYLNREFFELLRQRYRHRLCFVVARRGGEVVGGTTNVVKGDALYGRYWGALAPVRDLHFEVCYYAAIEHCIEAGLARFEPGAGGDYKFLRGFDARPTFSVHHLADARLARAIERFLDAERDQADATIAALNAQSARKAIGS